MFENKKIQFAKGSIEKRIWGHRLYDEQSGIMTLLEFLCVFSSLPFKNQTENRIFDDRSCVLRGYKAKRSPFLRSLIFNNPYIDEDRVKGEGESSWNSWYEKFCKDKRNEDANVFENGSVTVDEIKAVFNESGRLNDVESYANFKRIIHLIRQSGINVDSGKRWTSKFVFPWGRNCLYLDMNNNGGIGDRRFFGRNGEILYLMMSFAEKRDKLAEKINDKLLDSDHDLDALCGILSFNDAEIYETVPGGECILPIDFFEESKNRINILCEDLISVLSLKIPAVDMIEHLARIISLNLFCYFLEQGYAVLNKYRRDCKLVDRKIILCEALQKKASDVRRASKEAFRINSEQSSEAVKCYFMENNKDTKNNIEDISKYDDEDDEKED